MSAEYDDLEHLELRSSWIFEYGFPRPLGTKTQRIGREKHQEKLRQRRADTGTDRAPRAPRASRAKP